MRVENAISNLRERAARTAAAAIMRFTHISVVEFILIPTYSIN
jgi:hypothetical protein